jgi:hypothetical protein
VIVQMTLSFTFGEYIITLPNHRSISSIERSVRSRRRYGYSPCPRGSAAAQIEDPRDKGFQHSRCDHQRRGDIFRGHIYVPRLDRGYVFCGEGRIPFTNVRVQRVLIALLANVTDLSISVSRPSVCGQDGQVRSFSFFLRIAFLPFPPVEGILCKILLTRTTPNSWLIDLDLIRLIPLMTTRVIISLKKAAEKPQPDLTFGTLGGSSANATGRFPPRQVDDIPLSVFEGERR